MSAALAPPEAAPATVPALSRPPGPTLERRLAAVLAEAEAEGRAACPVCGGPMSAAGLAARELGCGACGSRLS